jgi:hypothetical protein
MILDQSNDLADLHSSEVVAKPGSVGFCQICLSNVTSGDLTPHVASEDLTPSGYSCRGIAGRVLSRSAQIWIQPSFLAVSRLTVPSEL